MNRFLLVFLSTGLVACGSGSATEREVAEHLQSVTREQGFELSRDDLHCLSATYVSVLGAENALAQLRQERSFADMAEEIGAERAMARQQELNQKLLECEAVPTPLNE
jgi:galactitol-specific phosphotransferase system IIB component